MASYRPTDARPSTRVLVTGVLATHATGLQVLLAPPPADLSRPISLPQVQHILVLLKRMFPWVIVDLGLPLNETAFGSLDTADRNDYDYFHAQLDNSLQMLRDIKVWQKRPSDYVPFNSFFAASLDESLPWEDRYPEMIGALVAAMYEDAQEQARVALSNPRVSGSIAFNLLIHDSGIVWEEIPYCNSVIWWDSLALGDAKVIQWCNDKGQAKRLALEMEWVRGEEAL